MNLVPFPILEKFQQHYAFLNAALVPFHLGQEGSDGVIYRFRGQDRLLKICFLGAGDRREDRLRFGKRLDFLAFLVEGGVPVVEPIPLADGRLFDEVEGESGWWVAYAMQKVPGETVSSKAWEPIFVQKWGETIGRLHRCTQAYPDWIKTVDPLTGDDLISWQSEMAGFIQLAEEPEIKAQWQGLQVELERLPVQRDCFGLIHNDPHLWNMRWDGHQAVLLDFETVNHHWFAFDICCACQHVVSGLSGGMTSPMQHPEWLADFLREFYQGYSRENSLSRDWLNRLELFFAYRRLLLYTVLPGWRKSKAALNRSWKKMILERPDIMRDVRI
jgi:Ser/Thr protein kinase RdoA (MazF antagonist)